MIERTQPVVKGVNEKGELLWDVIPMPRWQMEMFRVRYVGDFMSFWIKRMFYDQTGYEPDRDWGSLTIEVKPRKKKAWRHPGD